MLTITPEDVRRLLDAASRLDSPALVAERLPNSRRVVTYVADHPAVPTADTLTLLPVDLALYFLPVYDSRTMEERMITCLCGHVLRVESEAARIWGLCSTSAFVRRECASAYTDWVRGVLCERHRAACIRRAWIARYGRLPARWVR